jgi:hypothetical protein
MSTRTGVFIALAALGAACSGISSAQTGDPRIGHWAQQPGPRSVGMHVTYEDLGDSRFRLTLAAHSVPAQRQIVEAKCDGGTYPYADGNGKPTGNTLSCRFTAPRTVEYLFTTGDKIVWATSTGVETVSEDGSTLAWDAVHRDTSGRVVDEIHSRFSRRDDEPSSN